MFQSIGLNNSLIFVVIFFSNICTCDIALTIGYHSFRGSLRLLNTNRWKQFSVFFSRFSWNLLCSLLLLIKWNKSYESKFEYRRISRPIGQRDRKSFRLEFLWSDPFQKGSVNFLVVLRQICLKGRLFLYPNQYWEPKYIFTLYFSSTRRKTIFQV